MEPLKNRLNPAFLRRLADELAAAWPPFDRADFVEAATAELDGLELKPRIRRTAEVCRAFLPTNYR